MKGYYLETQSIINGLDVVVLIPTSKSRNRKTGDAVQVYYMLNGIDPTYALRLGADEAICGNCPFRPARYGGCYVTVFRAPLAVWRAYRRGSYDPLPPQVPKALRGKVLRLGAYGDPGAVSREVNEAIIRSFQPKRILGYTHQWKDPRNRYLRRYCMASVDSAEDRDHAHSLGFRTFRTFSLRVSPNLADREILCPNSTIGLRCCNCLLCDGTQRRATVSIAIRAHGYRASRIGARHRIPESLFV